MRLGASKMYSEMLSNDLQPQSCSSANVYCVARILFAITNKQQMRFLYVDNFWIFKIVLYHY